MTTDFKNASFVEAADFFSTADNPVTTVDIKQWINEGAPYFQISERKRRVNLLELAQWRFTGSTSISSGKFDPTRLPPLARRAWFSSEESRLKLMEKQKDLIPSRHHYAVVSQIFKIIVATTDSIPDILERDFNISPEGCGRIRDMLDEARQEMSTTIKGKLNSMEDDITEENDEDAADDAGELYDATE